MGKYRIEITEKANKDFQKHKKSGNKSILNKIDVIYNELKEHPFTGTGKPEPLKQLLAYRNFLSTNLLIFICLILYFHGS
jgi:Txe/YoeB family toxin of Txe-Axe toxin-antitoxin module